MSELLPCPFCGGEAETWDGAGPWHAICKKCGAIGSPCLSEAEAIAAWNNRTPIEYDGWFYLPKPKEAIAVYSDPEITRTENGYKVRNSAYVVNEAARKWGKELGEHIIKRICEVWGNKQTCHDTGKNDWHFVCSACGYEQNGYEQWNYCPNCGARVVGE